MSQLAMVRAYFLQALYLEITPHSELICMQGKCLNYYLFGPMVFFLMERTLFKVCSNHGMLNSTNFIC